MIATKRDGKQTDALRAERLKKTLKKYAIIIGIGIAYAIFVTVTGWGIPCPIYTVTHLQCPACGISRMLLSLLRLDFAAAWQYNPYLLINGPIILACLIASDFRYIRTGDGRLGKLAIVLWIEVVLALIFAILRNIL